jgi:hypothetical protein
MKNQPRSRWWWLLIGLLLGIAAALLVLKLLLTPENDVLYRPEVGDVLFQPLPFLSDLVVAIEGITHSPYSHCGVVVRRDKEWHVIEAAAQVTTTPLEEWIDRGRHNQYAAFRLKPEYEKIIPQFVEALHSYLGRPYDMQYDMDDTAIYCSELIYKGFRDATGDELGRLVRLGDLDWQPFRDTITRYGGDPPPLDRIMITPKHLAEAEQLIKIFEHTK